MSASWLRRVAAAATAAVAVTVAVSPMSATASVVSLPLSGYGDIVVDESRQQVFVSGGGSSNSVVVANFLGVVTRTIDGLPGVTGLELSQDGTRLFAALSAGDAIAVLNTTDFSAVARFSTGVRSCPTHLARTGTLIWYGYGCGGTFSGRIGRLDPALPPATAVTGEQQGTVRFQQAPLLASSGAASGPLVAGQLGLSESRVQPYAVANRTLVAQLGGEVAGSGLHDLDVTSDTAMVGGPSLFTAAGSRDRVDAFAASSLSGRGAYAARPRPVAVAGNPANAFVAVGAATTENTDVLVYRVGASTPARTFGLLPGEVVAAQGLAWSADLDRLFVISQRNNQPVPSLDVFLLATTPLPL